ncbi:MAG TPA: PaaI family thioesterase [Polyangiaceae bacterium]|nr:PaaI family thioesterase [Polyangiaceae bacterium]
MSEVVRAPKTTEHLRALERMAESKVGAPPIARLIGFDLTAIELGRSVMEFEAGERHANPMGTLHGGVICDVADAAMGTAFATTLEDDESFTTLDLNAKYFKPIWKAKLRATARVTKRTRTLGLIECEVEDEKGSLVAKVFSTCMVLRGEDARGR